MSNWVIDKEFGFDYGHRVWSQTLVDEFSMGHQCVCRHLHGHRGKLNIFLEGEELTRGMVTDFHHLNWLGHFIDDNIDHKFILDLNDPWFKNIINGEVHDVGGEQRLFISGERRLRLKPVFVPNTTHCAGWNLDVDHLSGPEEEFYEGFFLVNFLPTSEALCEWIAKCAEVKMERLGIKIQRVEWSETPKSRATYVL